MTVAIGPDATRSHASEFGYTIQYTTGDYDVILRLDTTTTSLREAVDAALVPPTEDVTISSRGMIFCHIPAVSVEEKTIRRVYSRTFMLVHRGYLLRARISRDGKETPEEIVDAFLETIDCSP